MGVHKLNYKLQLCNYNLKGHKGTIRFTVRKPLWCTYRLVMAEQTTVSSVFAPAAQPPRPACGSVLASSRTSDSALWRSAEAHAGCRTRTTLQTRSPCPFWRLLGAPCDICSTNTRPSYLHDITNLLLLFNTLTAMPNNGILPVGPATFPWQLDVEVTL